MARSALLNVMVQAAFRAGRVLARDFGEVQNLQVSLKGPETFVVEADRKAEASIRNDLMKARPTYGLLTTNGDEGGSDGAHRWIVDALDGRSNFLHGIPAFAVSLALERDGELVAGVILNPVTDELFTAERGGGAFMNDRRLRVAARRTLSDAVVGCAVPHLGRTGHDAFVARLQAVMAEVGGVRSHGSAALDLAFVAAGRFDAFWQTALHPWNIAAGIVLLREAGGFARDIGGGAQVLGTGSIVAGNETVQKALLKVLDRPRA